MNTASMGTLVLPEEIAKAHPVQISFFLKLPYLFLRTRIMFLYLNWRKTSRAKKAKTICSLPFLETRRWWEQY
jgi:hypothetical protein